ncbi:MAG TPA: hypothetical protein VJT81_12805 [Burkholderiales bacterium]|nr:hypothetical protein [Burkholderiales bacterium]
MSSSGVRKEVFYMPLEANSTEVDVHTFTASSTSATGSVTFTQVPKNPIAPAVSEQQVESAVYAHIRAMRSLGHTQVNTHTIANALSLPVTVVNDIVGRLHTRGVRVQK